MEHLSGHKGDIVVFTQLNKCMSDNQRLWRERVEMMEKKMDLTIKQKDLVSFMITIWSNCFIDLLETKALYRKNPLVSEIVST